MSQPPTEAANCPGPRDATSERVVDARSSRVHHRYAALVDFVPADEASLSQRERVELSTWHDRSRRHGWLAGRSLAKMLVAELIARQQGGGAVEQRRIEILSRDAQGRVNRPRVWCDGVEQCWSLSISHSQRGVVAALTASSAVALGVDLADRSPLSDGFVNLWFTAAERTWFHETQSPHTARFIWAAKEAIYKACNRGESFVPRDVEVLPDGRYAYRDEPLAGCSLQSWTIDGHLVVLAVIPAARISSSSPLSSTGNHP